MYVLRLSGHALTTVIYNQDKVKVSLDLNTNKRALVQKPTRGTSCHLFFQLARPLTKCQPSPIEPGEAVPMLRHPKCKLSSVRYRDIAWKLTSKRDFLCLLAKRIFGMHVRHVDRPSSGKEKAELHTGGDRHLSGTALLPDAEL